MPSSPVAPAVENTLGLFAGENEVARGVDGQLAPCHVFSYREDFDYLWGIGEHEGESPAQDMDGECSVVLVYDGIPEAPGRSAGPSINVRDYITAYDWAVHFFLSSVAGNQVPNVRLFILDVTSSQSSTPFAARRLPGLLPLMPWLQVYRLSDDLTDSQKRFGRFGVGIGKMAKEAANKSIESLAATDQEVTEAAEERVREAWLTNLTRPGGRHDVSNLVAPLVLADGLRSVNGLDAKKASEAVLKKDPRRAALAKLLQSLDMLQHQHESEEPVSSPLDTPMVKNNIFGQFDHVRFLLVDDQADLGYRNILASLLTGKENRSDADDRFSLHSITTPQPLVEGLFGVTALLENNGNEWSQPRVLDTLVSKNEDGSEQEKNFDVLLLDLRLFGATASGNSEEEGFLKRLVKFYEQSDADEMEDAYLKRAVRSARKRIKHISTASPEDSAEVMHLALLPLLLSYVDPSLPVVLFSSTRQQAVVEALAHRPNITTSFHKPVISGYAEGMSPRDYVAGLSDALADALRLHETRCIWNRVVKAEWRHMPVFEVKGREQGELEVYNLPQNASLREHPWKNKSRKESRGPRPPFLQGEDVTRNPRVLRTSLAQHYVRYIAGARYADYVTVPSELFEGALVPSRILKKPWLSNAEFALPEDLDPRNEVTRALRNLRNKKAHGFVYPPSGEEQKEKHRLASMLIFMLFLDFIEGRSETRNQSGALQRIKDHLKSSHYHVRQYGGNLEPYHLVNDVIVEWLEVVVYTASFAEKEATDPSTGAVFLSEETTEAVRRLAKLLASGNFEVVAGPPKPHPDPVSTKGTGERVIGKVKVYEVDGAYGFFENPQSGRDIFFHVTSLDEWIEKGQEVPIGTLYEFTVVNGDKGPEAKDAKRLL